jgi:hypothetical protein
MECVFCFPFILFLLPQKMKFWTFKISKKEGRRRHKTTTEKTKERNVDEEDPLRGHDGDDYFRRRR